MAVRRIPRPRRPTTYGRVVALFFIFKLTIYKYIYSTIKLINREVNMSALRKFKPIDEDFNLSAKPHINLNQMNLSLDDVFEMTNPFEALLIKNDAWVHTTKNQWASQDLDITETIEMESPSLNTLAGSFEI